MNSKIYNVNKQHDIPAAAAAAAATSHSPRTSHRRLSDKRCLLIRILLNGSLKLGYHKNKAFKMHLKFCLINKTSYRAAVLSHDKNQAEFPVS